MRLASERSVHGEGEKKDREGSVLRKSEFAKEKDKGPSLRSAYQVIPLMH